MARTTPESIDQVIRAAGQAYATAAAAELGYPSAAAWLAAQDTPEFKRRVLARSYRRNVETGMRYGSRAVATLLDYPFPIGPDPLYLAHPDREPADQAWAAAEFKRWNA